MNNDNLYYQIELTARKIRQYGQGVLDAQGIDITVEQWLVLKVVAEKERINQLGIGEILIKDKPTISKMIRALVAKDLLYKEASESDRREFLISLTSKGEKWMKDYFQIIEQIRLKGLESLSESQSKITSGVLNKIRKNLSS